MKDKTDPKTRRVLILLKFDSEELFNRVTLWKGEYLQTYALRRTREHFKKVFSSRYHTAGIRELLNCSDDVIIALHNFYTKIDELHWYLDHTQDMPGSVGDYVNQRIREIKPLFDTLKLYLESELDHEDTSPEDSYRQDEFNN